MSPLEESFAWCRRVARARAKNFYYSFVLLPRGRSDAMCALYAFMRYCDDLSDEPGASPAAMARWRAALAAALEGRFDAHPCWPAFHDTVVRYRIPHEYFFHMIDGVESDLEPRRFQNFDQLYGYCYRVASVVGLAIIHIFGFDDPAALPLAEKCGVAFQLTNILRDVKEDAGLGRIYLPLDDLRRFGIAGDDLLRGSTPPGFSGLMHFEAARARAYYQEAAHLIPLVHPHSRASLRALISIYSRLLERIEACGYDVFSRRVRLPAWEKGWLVVRSMAG